MANELQLDNKKLLRIGLISFLLVSVLFFIYEGSTDDIVKSNKTSENEKMQHSTANEGDYILDAHNKKVTREMMAQYWNGVEITSGNSLFVYPEYDSSEYNAAMRNFVTEVYYFTHEQWSDYPKVDAIMDKYLKTLGINGILDALLPYWRTEMLMESYDIHHWGQYAATRVPNNRRYAIEVCSRDTFVFAPLHGVVWESIDKHEDRDNTRKMFEFVSTELCYFKNYPNMANTYMACVHGVGHGFALIYEAAKVNKSIEICGMEKSYDFNYGCGGGVYMELILQKAFPMTKDNFFPCDTLLFPASCFRFVDLHPLTTPSNPYPCDRISSKYHQIACVWAEGYHNNAPLSFAHQFCSKYLKESYHDDWSYYRACADGYFNSQIGAFANAPKEVCDQFSDKYTKDLCMEYVNVLYKKVANQVTITSDDDDFRWNYDLLEAYREI